MAKRHYDVACGVIFNEYNQVLVALRDSAAEQGGLWEFPGGKINHEESVEDALCRELSEEVGVTVIEAHSWVEVNYEYPLYHVTLQVFKVVRWQGEPEGLEGQPVRWVDISELASLDFPAANEPIIEELMAE